MKTGKPLSEFFILQMRTLNFDSSFRVSVLSLFKTKKWMTNSEVQGLWTLSGWAVFLHETQGSEQELCPEVVWAFFSQFPFTSAGLLQETFRWPVGFSFFNLVIWFLSSTLAPKPQVGMIQSRQFHWESPIEMNRPYCILALAQTYLVPWGFSCSCTNLFGSMGVYAEHAPSGLCSKMFC